MKVQMKENNEKLVSDATLIKELQDKLAASEAQSTCETAKVTAANKTIAELTTKITELEAKTPQ
jgi:hypothetical protein